MRRVTSGEVRRPLGDEGADAFRRLAAGEQSLLRQRLVAEPLVERQLGGGIDRPAKASASLTTSPSVSRSTRPMASASSALTWRAVSMMSSARPWPTSRGSRWVPPAPGIRPSLTSGRPNLPRGPLTRIVHAIASSSPPPSARPSTAAIEIQEDEASRSLTARILSP
jgi:hypothetical protein